MRSDKSYDTYDRKVTDLLTMLGDIGGLNSLIFNLGGILIGFFIRKLFLGSITKKIYHIRKYGNIEHEVNKKTKISAITPSINNDEETL